LRYEPPTFLSIEELAFSIRDENFFLVRLRGDIFLFLPSPFPVLWFLSLLRYLRSAFSSPLLV